MAELNSYKELRGTLVQYSNCTNHNSKNQNWVLWSRAEPKLQITWHPVQYCQPRQRRFSKKLSHFISALYFPFITQSKLEMCNNVSTSLEKFRFFSSKGKYVSFVCWFFFRLYSCNPLKSYRWHFRLSHQGIPNILLAGDKEILK